MLHLADEDEFSIEESLELKPKKNTVVYLPT